MCPETPEHLPPAQLFALIWSQRKADLAEEGQEPDAELVRLFKGMAERLLEPLAAEHRLGPETARRLWEHALSCSACRMLLLEDGPESEAPKTASEEAQEEQRLEDKRKEQVKSFWINLVVGSAAFAGAFYCINDIRSREAQVIDVSGGTISAIGNAPMDPMWFGFAGSILVASWFLAEAYTLAKDLWIDFTAWKRAVPVVGKKWAAKGKPPERPED